MRGIFFRGDLYNPLMRPVPESTLSGIGLMLLAIFCWTVMDALAKFLGDSYGTAQIACLRSVFGLVVVLVLILPRAGIVSLRVQRPAWQFARAALGAGAMFGFFHALKTLPLADVVVIGFASPIIVTAMSVPVLGEKVGGVRWAAVLVGFAGVVIVLRPGAGLFDPAALIALGATLCYAMMTVSARLLRNTESSAVLTVWPLLGPIVLGFIFMLPAWQTPTAGAWGLFALMGLLGGIAFIAAVASLRRAAAVVVVPFEYSAIIWATLIGYFVWQDVPKSNTLAGAAIVIAAGVFIALRELRAHESTTEYSRPATIAVPDAPPPFVTREEDR